MALATLPKFLSSRPGSLSIGRRIGQFFPVRQRYLLTRDNKIRLRYVAAPALAVLLLAGAVAGPLTTNLMTRVGGQQVASTEDDKNFVPATYQEEAANDQTDDDDAVADATAPAQAPLQAHDKTVKIGRGDTLNAVLEKAGVSSAEAYNAVEALKPYYNPRSLLPGQKLSLHFEPVADANTYNFSQLNVPLDALSTVHLIKNTAGVFQASIDKKEAVRRLYARKANIDVSLYGSAVEAHIPPGIIAAALRIYSWNVDFQRDIQPGDALEVMYDQYEAPDGTPIRSGDIVYAKLTVNGQDMPIYRFQTKNGDVDYFGPAGTSVRKALLTTPVDGARITSGFGMRVHPVLGFTKMHKGVDFGAPVGTPVYAAGTGTIEKIGPFSTYGNYVRIRHNSTLKTAYAHLSRFAPGLTSGSHVKQGQVIAYVGQTGRATGPHLHYEVLINDQQVNPRGVKVQQGEALAGAQLDAFKAHVRDLGQRYTTMLANKLAAVLPPAGQPETRLR